MTAPIAAASIAERLADEIGSGHVVAALFSTFTFRREFFERVPLSLITDEGRRRGFLPITVAVDRTQFEGNGWGYDVARAPGDRRWHAKLIALMVNQNGSNRTIFALGSGNLTRSGWERNLELFHLDAWSGWRLPAAVAAWLRLSWLKDSAFARWTRENGLGTGRRNKRSILGTLTAPLWNQLAWVRRGRSWSELHVVSPFGDVEREDDGDADAASACGPFFDAVVAHAEGESARLTVYLRGVDEHGKRAYGDRALLKRVAASVKLRVRAVPSEAGRLLHAKLVAARTRGRWSVVLGSPNATGAAFVTPDRNIELACELRGVGRTLPRGLLPASREIGLDDVILPEHTVAPPRWECLESATYDARRRRIVLGWFRPHGFFDSRILLAGRDLDPDRVDLGTVEDRFLECVPLGAARRSFAPDFVPIEVSDEEPDCFDPTSPVALSADDWLARLDGAPPPGHGDGGSIGRGGTRFRSRHARPQGQRFEWRERVVLLEGKLRGLESAMENASSKREVEHLRKLLVGTWGAHDPKARGLAPEVRAWRRWVRAALWRTVEQFDKRRKAVRPLTSLARRWKRALPRTYRELDLG